MVIPFSHIGEILKKNLSQYPNLKARLEHSTSLQSFDSTDDAIELLQLHMRYTKHVCGIFQEAASNYHINETDFIEQYHTNPNLQLWLFQKFLHMLETLKASKEIFESVQWIFDSHLILWNAYLSIKSKIATSFNETTRFSEFSTFLTASNRDLNNVVEMMFLQGISLGESGNPFIKLILSLIKALKASKNVKIELVWEQGDFFISTRANPRVIKSPFTLPTSNHFPSIAEARKVFKFDPDTDKHAIYSQLKPTFVRVNFRSSAPTDLFWPGCHLIRKTYTVMTWSLLLPMLAIVHEFIHVLHFLRGSIRWLSDEGGKEGKDMPLSVEGRWFTDAEEFWSIAGGKTNESIFQIYLGGVPRYSHSATLYPFHDIFKGHSVK